MIISISTAALTNYRSCRDSNDWSNDSDCVQLLQGSMREPIPESMPVQKSKHKSYGAFNRATDFNPHKKPEPFGRKTGTASKSNPTGTAYGRSGANDKVSDITASIVCGGATYSFISLSTMIIVDSDTHYGRQHIH